MDACLLPYCTVVKHGEILKEQLLAMERKALKCSLGVKSSVPNDIVYQELNIPDIVAKIMRLQQKLFAKIMIL